MDIRSLADQLGISIGTVSRALNDRKDVSPATRQRVIEAADALGYMPNQSGRALRSGRTGSIGFMLTLGHDSAVHGDPFFLSLFEGIQRRLALEGLDLIVLLAREDEDAFDVLRRNVARRLVDGWFLSATQRNDRRVPFLLERNIPFVALGRTDTQQAYSWIDLDFESVVRDAMAHLMTSAHRRIGLIAPPPAINNSHVVIDAYRAELTRVGIPFDAALVHQGDVDEDHGAVAIEALMTATPPPSAVLVMGETAPIGVYRGLRAMSLEPGRDVAVIGLRDNPFVTALSPGLTCFSLSLDALGDALGDAILKTLSRASAAAEPLQILWPMTLVRKTSDDAHASS